MKKQITKGKVIQRCMKVVAAVVVAGGVGFQFHEIQELNEELTVLTGKHKNTVQALNEMSDENDQVRDQYTVLAAESEKMMNEIIEAEEANVSLKKKKDSLLKDKAALQGETKKLKEKNKSLSIQLQQEKERPSQVVATSSKPSPKPSAKTTPAKVKTPVVQVKKATPAPAPKPASVKKATAPAAKTISGSATAYNADCKGCTGITASGKKVGPGMVAMAGWVPLGTKVRITCPSYPSINGVYTVEDRGGAIKGNKVDIFVSTYSQAIEFGRRDIQIEILN